MNEESNLSSQVDESPKTPVTLPAKKPKCFFKYVLRSFVLLFAILGEIYLALFGYTQYLYLSGIDATTIRALLGLKGSVLERWDGPWGIMDFFYVFFISIPTLRILCFFCFIYFFTRWLFTYVIYGTKTNTLIRVFLLLWLIYYIGFFLCISYYPVYTDITWPFTPFLPNLRL